MAYGTPGQVHSDNVLIFLNSATGHVPGMQLRLATAKRFPSAQLRPEMIPANVTVSAIMQGKQTSRRQQSLAIGLTKFGGFRIRQPPAETLLAKVLELTNRLREA